MIIKTCLALLSPALLIGVAAAQTSSGPTGNGRQPPTVDDHQLQLIRPQIGGREDEGPVSGSALSSRKSTASTTILCVRPRGVDASRRQSNSK
jgi:hypothetical protein